MEDFVFNLINEVKKRPILWDRSKKQNANRFMVDSEWAHIAACFVGNRINVRQKWKSLKDQYNAEMKKIKIVNGEEVYIGTWRYYKPMSFFREALDKNRLSAEWFQHKRTLDSTTNGNHDLSDSFAFIKKIRESDKKIGEEEMYEETEVLSHEKPTGFNCESYSNATENPDLSDPILIKVEIRDSDEEIVKAETYEETEVLSHEKLTTNCESYSRKRKAPTLNSTDMNLVETEVKRLQDSLKQPEITIDDDVHFAMSLVPFLKRLSPLRKMIVRNDIQSLIIKELISDKNKSEK